MGYRNLTEFVLLGLFHNEDVKAMCSVLFLFCYLAILCGNLVVVLTIRCSHLSEHPMYFFLSYLSFMDVCFTSTVAPKLIIDFLVQCNTISYNGCIAQMFSAHFFGATEIFVLVVMAYDRYIAICRPLYYMITMNRPVCYILVTVSVIGAFMHSLLHVLIVIRLPFCGANEIDHYFCDIFPLLKLACTDTRFLTIIIITTTGVMSILTFVALVISYIIILSTLKTCSSKGRHKALSTCGSHITVVFMFFLPLIFTYVPMSDSVGDDKVFALFYTMIAPLFNPLIYTLRNTDMKNAMRKVWCQEKVFERK
ncbi:olfactory receptor 4P4 [Cricetulus griseus]|uniref:Olfactory receptor n=2 Tax=Cricetulus griseus TaxID=10029 RepID=A0A061I2B3_CRIGR|nr:olfactory receptor 4P4 [Cricetulus griseus]XP_027276903.1 olfactory receptor 4P4 [Cricetulus griseus]ERE71641.1 olfactory receptor 4P4-like protein [Cricetulus griseus]